MDYPLRPGLATRLLYLRSVDVVVAISHSVRTALTSGGVTPERIRLIPSGIDTARFTPDPSARERIRSQYGVEAHIPLVVSVGALVDRKGHNVFLTAAHYLKEQGCNARYLICGDGPLHPVLAAQVQTLRLRSEIHFTGFRSDIPELLAAADYFVHVPYYEGLGIAVLEALASGLPTIASRVGGIPEIIEDGKTGMLVPAQDAKALSATLIRLFNDPHFSRQLGRTGQTFVRERFDISVMARTNEALYKELLADTA
jgi:glycosyltransferase involved in cell wall biosynthesis